MTAELPDAAQQYYISFDTKSNPGKLEAIRVRLDCETIADMKRPLSIDLCNHPLYAELEEYVLANPTKKGE
jgi:hypothetical protein